MPVKPEPRLYKRPPTAHHLEWWWNCIPLPERTILTFMLSVTPPGPPSTLTDVGILIMRAAYPDDFEQRIDNLLADWQITEQTIPLPDGGELKIWTGLTLAWAAWYVYEQLNPGWRFWSCIYNDFNTPTP